MANTADRVEGTTTDESRRDRLARHGRRTKLYTWAIALVVLLIILVALIVANTRKVKVDRGAGSARASLVWIFLAAGVLGWLPGIVTSFMFRRRTRRTA